jgi:ABC-type nitrate/sulfonate/bicarbonate transport system permease component
MTEGSLSTSARGAASAVAIDADDPNQAFERRLLAAHQRRQRRQRVLQIGLGAGVPLLGFVIWQILTEAGALNSTFFPAPTTIVGDMFDQFTSGPNLAALASALGITMRDVAFGFLIGAVTGVVAGVAMGISRRTYFGFSPLVYGTFPTPKIALYPLFLVIFGLGSPAAIALAALSSFYMVCINTLSGIRFSPGLYGEVGSVFSVPRLSRYLKVVVPAAAPSIITGLRLGLSDCLVIVLAVEYIGSSVGMGAYIWNAYQILAVGQMFTGLILTMIIGGAVILLGNVVEHVAVPWSRNK